MRTVDEIQMVQNELLNSLVNTDDEREKVFFQAQVRILSWVLSEVEPEVNQVPVSESNEEEAGGVK